MKQLSQTYNKAFFEWHRPLKEDYLRIGKYLADYRNEFNYGYGDVLDIGCGNGYFLEGFPTHVYTVGVESSHCCIPEAHSRSRIRLMDASMPFFFNELFHLVICTEVGEHLPPESADTLVNNIYNHARRDVFFSAATPGQGGHDHLNEQPHSYWIEKFSERGFTVDEKRTKEIREFAATTALSWIRDNAIMFTRVG